VLIADVIFGGHAMLKESPEMHAKSSKIWPGLTLVTS